MIRSVKLLRLILVASVAFLALTASPHAQAQETHWCMQQPSDWSRTLRRLSSVALTSPYVARSTRIELLGGLDGLRRSYNDRETDGPSPLEVCAPFFHELIAVARSGEALVADDEAYGRNLRLAGEACESVQYPAFHAVAMCPMIAALNAAESRQAAESTMKSAQGRCATETPRREWQWIWDGLCNKISLDVSATSIADAAKKIRQSQAVTLRQLSGLVDETIQLCTLDESRGIAGECIKEVYDATEDILAHHLVSGERRTAETFDGYQSICSKLEGLGTRLPVSVRPRSDKCTRQMHVEYVQKALRECRDRSCRKDVYAVAEASPVLQASQGPAPVEAPPSAADLHRRRQLRIATGVLWSLTIVTAAGGVYLATQVLDEGSGKYALRVRDSAVSLGFPKLGDDPCALIYTDMDAGHRARCGDYENLKTATYTTVGVASALFVGSLVTSVFLKRALRERRLAITPVTRLERQEFGLRMTVTF